VDSCGLTKTSNVSFVPCRAQPAIADPNVAAVNARIPTFAAGRTAAVKDGFNAIDQHFLTFL
jgi:hypothetical protein